MNTRDYDTYERNRMIYWENESAMKNALVVGEKKGIEIGEKKGIEIGEKKGIEIGIEEGMDKKAYAMVRNCLLRGYSDEVTSELAEVSLEFVAKVKAQLKKEKLI